MGFLLATGSEKSLYALLRRGEGIYVGRPKCVLGL